MCKFWAVAVVDRMAIGLSKRGIGSQSTVTYVNTEKKEEESMPAQRCSQ
jgi:hypothetical protein